MARTGQTPYRGSETRVARHRAAFLRMEDKKQWVAVKAPSANLAPAQLTILALTPPRRGNGTPVAKTRQNGAQEAERWTP